MVTGLQSDDFQLISCSYDTTIAIHNFLDPVPQILGT